MMLNKDLAAMLNDQVNKELYSAYLYLDMANFYAIKGLNGFANWYVVQTQEEESHAMLIRKYLLNNSEPVNLMEIAKPDKTFMQLDDPLKVALEHERYVTSLIHSIYDKAAELKDYRTMQFLDWFVKEQGEEEENAEGLVNQYHMFGNDSKGLFLMDAEMKTREFHPPSLKL